MVIHSFCYVFSNVFNDLNNQMSLLSERCMNKIMHQRLPGWIKRGNPREGVWKSHAPKASEMSKERNSKWEGYEKVMLQRCPLFSFDFLSFPLISYGFLCFLLISFDYQWFVVTTFDFLWLPLISFDFLWCPMIYFGFLWFPMISFGLFQFPVTSFDFCWFPFISLTFHFFN